MQLGRFVLPAVLGLFFLSATTFAQESTDSTVNLTPPPTQKKIVKKRIRKADAKTAIQKKIVKKQAVKPVKVAEASTSAAADVGPVADPDSNVNFNEPPTLGASEANRQQPGSRYAFQQAPPYQPIYIIQPAQAAPPAPAPSPAPVAQAPSAAQLAAAGPTTSGAQVQPTTNVDSTTVAEPKSEQLRKQREELEHQTENQLMEKLEDDRLAAEKERANRILNPQLSPAPEAPAPSKLNVEVAPVAPVTPAPSPVAAVPALSQPAPVPSESPKIEAGLQGETVSKSENHEEKKEENHIMSAGLRGGLPSYPTVNNVAAYYSLGVLGSYQFADRFSLQMAFDYSRFNITNVSSCYFCYAGNLIKGLNQYNFTVGTNYNILSGPITPVVGALVGYTRRNYYDVLDYGYTYGTPTGSNAFDVGLMIGADVKLSKQLILGAQFAYLWNISYWTDNPLAYGLYGPIYGSPIETLNYYLATLSLRFLF